MSSPTNPDTDKPGADVVAMGDSQLRRILLTCDGKGVAAKAAALDELLRRARASSESA